MNRKLSTITVPNGFPASIAGPGKFLRIVRTVPIAQVTVSVDSGRIDNAVAGMELEYGASVKAAQITCPGAGVDVVIQYYIGDTPFVANPKTEPGQSFHTTDTISIPANGAVFVQGNLTAAGTKYRRKKITVANLTGLAGFNAAATCIWGTTNSALASIVNASLGIPPYTGDTREYPLLPSTGGQIFPFSEETDDTILLAPPNAGTVVDLSIVQIWLPVTQ